MRWCLTLAEREMLIDSLAARVRACIRRRKWQVRRKDDIESQCIYSIQHLISPPSRNCRAQSISYCTVVEAMSSPGLVKARRYILTASVTAITVTGAWYGAGLKMRREFNEVSLSTSRNVKRVLILCRRRARSRSSPLSRRSNSYSWLNPGSWSNGPRCKKRLIG